MRATLIERDGDRATVRLTPSWVARLLGARETLAELHAPSSWDDGELRWRFVATRRDVRGAEHGELILRSLERVPMTALPGAMARRT